jgi:leucyl-tRNA synthetase
MAYNFQEIDKKWQNYWAQNETFKAHNDSDKPKYYVLDMFPYPSGAGLHVGHPLGYIASDIYTRYKRNKGFNVLHPMGYDAFGLPAEQYAIQTGQHPAVTTEANVIRYKEQLDRIGFSFDWSRQVKTCDPSYYKWTQWAFTQMFEHYYDTAKDKALPIEEMKSAFASGGSAAVQAWGSKELNFSAQEWQAFDKKKKEEILQNYRIAYLDEVPVNWCPALGTVLANDEVKDGLSERGGHPVEQKVMKQWCLRVSAYSQRLLDRLESLDWSESMKEVQRNWIGRSEGAQVEFAVKDKDFGFEIFTTRPDTMYGVTFMVLAPESEYVEKVVTASQKAAVDQYLEECKKKSQRDRMMETKSMTGVFTGAYCVHPFSGKEIPIWIGDYVLGGYGTGAIMAVPAHDSRDHAFAKTFDLPIIPVIEGEGAQNVAEASYDAKEGKLINSDILNGLEVKEAITRMLEEVEAKNLGTRKVNYRLRDAIFSRQRYWGEPFPVYYVDDEPHMLSVDKLPLELPEVDKYLPTEDGDPPLGRAKKWQTEEGHPFELSTMPGFAGSSAYFLRYMDPNNNDELVSKEANAYWKNVDLYVGGPEHGTGHLIYSRFWNKFLYDLGVICEDEPFKKMVNQGMIQGRSNFVYRLKSDQKTFVSATLAADKKKYDTQEIHVDVNIVQNDILDIEAFKKWRPEFADASFILEKEGDSEVYKCGWAIEKMSKSKYNVVNPDTIANKYGADTLRLYEMFLGPLEQSKPWNTNGIEGVYRFLIKFWNLFHEGEELSLSDEKATPEELKVLHTCLKKVQEDMDNFSFNTTVAAFMIAANDLAKLKCNKREVLSDLVVALSPFAPHTAEELWQKLGATESVSQAAWPVAEEKYLVESNFNYPVSFNGKMRFLLELPVDYSKEQIQEAVLAHENSQKWLEGKEIKKVIIVPKKIVNIVVG